MEKDKLNQQFLEFSHYLTKSQRVNPSEWFQHTGGNHQSNEQKLQMKQEGTASY